MFSLPSIAMIVVTKAGYHLAKKRKLLPKGVYHLLSLDSIKAGDFEMAVEYNALARQKDPDYEKAQVVHDLLRMNRDARVEEIRAKVEHHMLEIAQLSLEKKSRQEQVKQLLNHNRTLKWRVFTLVTLFFALAGTVWSLGIRFHFTDYLWLAPALFSGILLLYLGQRAFVGARQLIHEKEDKAIDNKIFLKQLNRDTELHRKTIRKLGEEMLQIRAKVI